jgi:nifR3 family TIM-barrel protein
MQTHTLVVGDTQIKNNIFLAPMAGYTDYAFRKLALSLGIGLAFTELVSAKGLMYGGNGSKDLLFCGDDISKTCAQIFGADAYFMRSACESEHLKDFKIIDINMGCPVPKVFKNGEGSALLTDIKKAENIIKECVKSGKIITVKIRTGQKQGDDIAADFAKMAEDAGASLITVHGRVREAYYSGEPDYNAIEKAKNAVKIPVIANGGLFTEEDCDKMIERTGADGVMLARGAIANPFLICELLGEKPSITKKEFIIKHISLMASRMEDRRAALEFRKFTPYYFKGMTGIKDLKTAIQTCENTEQIIRLIEENF